MNLMTPARFRHSRLTILGLLLSQALGLNSWSSVALAQSPNGAAKALPSLVSPSSLTGLDQPPQIAPLPKQALPSQDAPSYLGSGKQNNQAQLTDLISLIKMPHLVIPSSLRLDLITRPVKSFIGKVYLFYCLRLMPLQREHATTNMVLVRQLFLQAQEIHAYLIKRAIPSH
jgi:hypothetical protein